MFTRVYVSLVYHVYVRLHVKLFRGARRSTGGYNTRHDMYAPWAGINEDLLYAHAPATDHTWYGMVWYWLEQH